VLVYLAVAVALGLMLPRLLSAQFGLFDDGYTLMTARKILGGEWSILQVPWEISAGRLRPTYWLLNSLLYLVGGLHPTVYFLANAVLLAGTAAGLVALVLAKGGSRVQAATAGLVFILSGPAVESYYTLSKGEPAQAAFLVASLLLVGLWARARGIGQNLAVFAGTALCLFLAAGAKETALIMLPVSAAWSVVGWLRRRTGLGSYAGTGRRAYLLANVFVTVVSLGAVILLRGASFMTGGYSSHYGLDLRSLLETGTRWAGWLTRDFGYLLPLLLFVMIWWVARRNRFPQLLLVDSLIWMVGWVMVFVPFGRFTVEYYMLPFALGAAIFAGEAAGHLRAALRDPSRWARIVAGACLSLAGVLWAVTLPNNISNARQQLAVDAANTAMLDAVARTAPQQAQLLVNIQESNEYVVEIRTQLAEVYRRGDIQVAPVQIQEASLGAAGPGPVFAAIPSVENEPLLSVRMGVIEDTQRPWNQALGSKLGGTGRETFHAQERFRLSIVDVLRPFCVLFGQRGYCASSRPILDLREFAYGWDVVQIVP
jgi:4-amino-4-deoxy-L-arabinose transferase-like glycosyltransferase